MASHYIVSLSDIPVLQVLNCLDRTRRLSMKTWWRPARDRAEWA